MSGPGRERLRLGAGVAAYLAAHPAAWRDGIPWLLSLPASGHPFRRRIPWMPFAAIRWLTRTVGPGTEVFEFGAGASTLFFSDRARRVVSVEHDSDWAEMVLRGLSPEGRGRTTILVRPPGSGADAAFASDFAPHGGMNFRAYATAIDAEADGSLDLVVVDGRARMACLARAAAKVKAGGHVLLDDSSRAAYASAAALMSRHERLDFRGAAPHKLEISQATAWRIGT